MDKLADQVKIGKSTPIVNKSAFPSKPNAIPIMQHSWPATGNRGYGHTSTNPVFTKPIPGSRLPMVDWVLADKFGKPTAHGGSSRASDFTQLKKAPPPGHLKAPPPPPPPPPPRGMGDEALRKLRQLPKIPRKPKVMPSKLPTQQVSPTKPGFRTGRAPRLPRGLGGAGTLPFFSPDIPGSMPDIIESHDIFGRPIPKPWDNYPML